MKMPYNEQLKRLRKEKNLSQRQLADLLFVDRSTVASWETGRRIPDYSTWVRLSECLGEDIASFFETIDDFDKMAHYDSIDESEEKTRIMIIDDEKIVLSGEIAILNKNLPDVEIIGFIKPSEAMDYVKTHQISLAFVDIEMGKTNGLDFSRQLLTLDNVYHRGPWFGIQAIPMTLILFQNLCISFANWKKYSLKQIMAIVVFFLAPELCFLFEILFLGVMYSVIGMAAASIILFAFVYTEQVDNTIALEKENTVQQVSIIKLQMRPHFIYNTLSSIYYLCSKDPEKAQQVILDFTDYLRLNYTAISRAEQIPFSKELEHTKAYLSIEQVRFEDQLIVQYDIAYMNFLLPPLTLQPIVENAVKHGIDPELKPLSISIRTRLTE